MPGMPESSFSGTAGPAPPSFHQPKPVVRWLGVALAAAGAVLSYQLLLYSAAPQRNNPLVELLCGGKGGLTAEGDCGSVLTSPQAYVRLGREVGALKLPVSALGLAYFLMVGLWYLFVGPPSRSRRLWHLPLLLLVLAGAWQSVGYILIMHQELHRWCGGCLAVHALNGGLLALTAGAWPWRTPRTPEAPHPTPRLALSTATAGVLGGALTLLVVYLAILGGVVRTQQVEYERVLRDPEFIAWDVRRQPVVDELLLSDDLLYEGDPAAPHTVVVFSDLQCGPCAELHRVLTNVLAQHAGRVRVAYRHYPEDPDCNSDPRFRIGGHFYACRAARAVEAAGLVGGPAAAARLRALIYERQRALPVEPPSRQTADQRALVVRWAGEVGLDRAAFEAALESDAVAARIAADVLLARRLQITGTPMVYLDGRRVRGWREPAVWNALLASREPIGDEPAPAGTGARPAAGVDRVSE